MTHIDSDIRFKLTDILNTWLTDNITKPTPLDGIIQTLKSQPARSIQIFQDGTARPVEQFSTFGKLASLPKPIEKHILGYVRGQSEGCYSNTPNSYDKISRIHGSDCGCLKCEDRDWVIYESSDEDDYQDYDNSPDYDDELERYGQEDEYIPDTLEEAEELY